MTCKLKECLTFDDVMLEPQYSTVKSRSDIDISVKIEKLGFTNTFQNPIIPANMSSIMNYEMAEAIYLSGGLGLMHRFMPGNDQMEFLFQLEEAYGDKILKHIGLSVGVKEDDVHYVGYFVEGGAAIICIDVAHGDSEQCVKMVEHISQKYPHILLIAGNVATGSGAKRLWEAGADIVKVGIGASGICLTRINAAAGVPQLSALMDVKEAQQQMLSRDIARNKKRNYYIIADGGAKSSGDLVKALCFADLVMTGNLFAGCQECPGDVITASDGTLCKQYIGSSTHKNTHIEGIEALVPCKETYQEELSKLLQGIRSGCSYQNAHNLEELKDNPVFIRMTHAGKIESGVHDVILK